MKRSLPQPALAPREILLLGACIGLVAGLGETMLRVVQVFLLDGRSWIGSDFLWMTPLALLGFFLVVAAILAVLAVVTRRPAPAVFVLAAFLFLATAGPLLAIGRVHRYASLLVALGIGVQLARLATPRLPIVLRASRRALPLLAGLVLALAALTFGRERLAEIRQLAGLPATRANAPNILLIILDTVRAASLSVYGYDRPTTPNLERIAREGVVFEHAWSTSPWTLPSHASIFTGRFAHELSTDLVTPLDRTFPTLAEHFRDRGYVTAGFSANILYATREVGLSRGFIRYEDYPVSAAMVANSALLTRRVATTVRHWLGNYQKLVRVSADDVTDAFLDWESARSERPFFAFLNYFDAHAPYLPPDSLLGRFGPARTRHAAHDLSGREHWSDAEVTAERAAYEGAIAFMDQEVGRLLDALESRGLLENTAVIIASDHGEQFGEHGLMDHGNSLYRALLEVPLLVRFPDRVPAGLRIARPVSLRDLAATLVDLSGYPEAAFPGSSLARLWVDSAAATSPPLSEVRGGIRTAPWLPLAKGTMKSLVAEGHHYIENGDGREELYDLGRDPLELEDLVASEQAEPVLRRLRSRVEALLDATTSAAAPDVNRATRSSRSGPPADPGSTRSTPPAG